MMTLKLTSTDTIQTIQTNFRSLFTHLRPEFYKKSHNSEEGNAKNEQYLHNITLAEMTGNAEDILLDIDPNMSTNDFEQYVKKPHQLNIQLFRLQRGTWLQTTLSDALSLEAQNQKGIQADINIAAIKPTDVDLE